jgi:hypothetical protein
MQTVDGGSASNEALKVAQRLYACHRESRQDSFTDSIQIPIS